MENFIDSINKKDDDEDKEPTPQPQEAPSADRVSDEAEMSADEGRGVPERAAEPHPEPNAEKRDPAASDDETASENVPVETTFPTGGYQGNKTHAFDEPGPNPLERGENFIDTVPQRDTIDDDHSDVPNSGPGWDKPIPKEAPSQEKKSTPAKSGQAQPRGVAVSGDAPTDALNSLLDRIYGPDRNAALEAAIKNEAHQQSIANDMRVGEKFTQAFSRLRGGHYKADDSFANAMEAQGKQGVANEVLKQKLSDEGVVSAMKLSDLDDKSKLSDPSSNVSQAYRNMARTLTPQLAASPGFDQMSAETIKQAQPMIDTAIKQSYLNFNKKMVADSKKEADQNRSYNQTLQQLEQMRGSPAVAQAEKDAYAAQKARSLIAVAAPNGDLNKMSDAQAKLLTMEIGKIANGGQSTQAELNALDPKTLTGHLSKVWGQLANNPTPANAGAFLKQYQDYAGALTKDAQDTIQQRYGRMINSRKQELNPNQVQALQDNYINRFASQDTPQAGAQKIKVHNPHTGETYMIDPADLPHAQAEKFVQVK